MATIVIKNGHQKHVFYYEIGLRAQKIWLEVGVS